MPIFKLNYPSYLPYCAFWCTNTKSLITHACWVPNTWQGKHRTLEIRKCIFISCLPYFIFKTCNGVTVPLHMLSGKCHPLSFADPRVEPCLVDGRLGADRSGVRPPPAPLFLSPEPFQTVLMGSPEPWHILLLLVFHPALLMSACAHFSLGTWWCFLCPLLLGALGALSPSSLSMARGCFHHLISSFAPTCSSSSMATLTLLLYSYPKRKDQHCRWESFCVNSHSLYLPICRGINAV